MHAAPQASSVPGRVTFLHANPACLFQTEDVACRVTLALVRDRETGGPQQASGAFPFRGQPRRRGEGKAEWDPCEGRREKRWSAWVGLKGTRRRGLARAPAGDTCLTPVDVSIPCSCVSLW